ncbi:hypothetical protein [Sphingomonas oligophenolica]|uniref:hypothetical protein n=1 Tax=Sphingomonas oligophenolica TaxID=301154 RepID=UPI001F4FC4F1|nr:hypothetical protein [Sphingomonas oligophenolica]
MTLKRIGLIALVLGIGLGTAACTDGYGYSGLSVGYGSGSYYGDGYDTGYGYGSGYDSGYGSPYYGWYNDYYYPGTGIYVYDQYRRPYRWNDGQRRYWEGRRNNWRGDRNYRNDWNGFQRNNNRDGRYDGNRGNGGDRTWNRNDRRSDNHQGTAGNPTWQHNDGDRRDWRNRRNDGTPRMERPGRSGGYSDRGNRNGAPVIGVSPQAAVRTSPAPVQVREGRREERGRRAGNDRYVDVRPE